MDSGYKCNVKIFFESGDVQIDVSNEKQTFSFKSGVAWVTLPQYFSKLSQFYKGEIKEARLDCHGNSEYYNYSTDGINLIIEHVDNQDPKNLTFFYQFNLRKYLVAVDKGFKNYIEKLDNEGVIMPLKGLNMYHPLNEKVLNHFYQFSSLLKSS